MVLDQQQAKRYVRHFALKEIGISGQKKLLSSKVLVIGAGGLGSPAIMYLTIPIPQRVHSIPMKDLRYRPLKKRLPKLR